MKTIAITCVLICMLLSNTASADITYNVTGTVDNVFYSLGLAPPPVSVGSSLTGQFTFDVLAPRIGGGTDVSIFPGAVTSVSLTLSGPPSINITGTGAAITVSNLDLTIELHPIYGTTATAIEGIPYEYGHLSFADTTGALFSTNPPPLVKPDDPLLSPSGFSFDWKHDNTEYVHVDGTFAITPVPVPVPGALLLGSIGVGMVGWLKRRKKA